MKDYNLINWNEIFIEDNNSPTGLVWKLNRMRGKGIGNFAARAGDNAGCIKYYKNDNVKRAIIHLNGTKWLAHRVLWVMKNGYLENNYVIDHIDGNTLNNNISNLRKVLPSINAKNSRMRGDNTSGKTGVNFRVSGKITYAVATWMTADFKTKSLCFRVDKLGLLPAYSNACSFRDSKIIELNAQGAGYSDRHGK